MASSACIIDGVRTPRGRGRADGSLHTIHPQELLAQTLNAVHARVGFERAEVDDVLVGNASNQGDHGACIGRLGVLAAGWPVQAPGLTINRYCGSGQQAIGLAAMGIRSGMQRLVVAGGVESMSRFTPAMGAGGFEAGNDALRSRYGMVPQGISADLIASLERFDRETLDGFAVTSQDRAARAIAEGRFAGSLISVTNADGSVALDQEENPRPGTTVESLAALTPAFEKLGRSVPIDRVYCIDELAEERYPQARPIRHVHHAGNSSGVVDGAAAMLLASSDWAAAHGAHVRAEVVMHAVAGADPVIMLTAPGPASLLCLDRANMAVSDIDLWEINEAFAAVPLKTIRDLDLDLDRVNVNGGAIALGHPIGASGVMLIQTALDELERQDLATALITMCTGGGMATATIIQRV